VLRAIEELAAAASRRRPGWRPVPSGTALHRICSLLAGNFMLSSAILVEESQWAAISI
jgi:hypothetical protein